MGSSWSRPVTVPSCTQPVKPWVQPVLGYTGLSMIHSTRCYSENNVTLTMKLWPDQTLGWTKSISVCITETSGCKHEGSDSFKSSARNNSHSVHAAEWKAGDESLARDAWTSGILPCRGLWVSSQNVWEWMHVSAGGREAVIHSELRFVWEQNWFWCPEGIQHASFQCVL